MSFIAMVNVMGMRSIIYLVITQMVKPHANAAILKIDDSLCPARETVDIIGNGTAKNETVYTFPFKQHRSFGYVVYRK